MFGLSAAPAVATALAGDVGARRYYRLRGEGSGARLLVLYPEPRSAAQESWRVIRDAFQDAGLRVPAIHADAPEIGAAVIEDLGDRDLASDLAELPHEDRPRLLEEAEELLVLVRAIDEKAALRNPPFDAAFFASELVHTRLWALEHGGSDPLPAETREAWDRLAATLAKNAADPQENGPLVPTHRDFHANNLMRASDGRLALIDFQDLRLGPRDYDPVSLRFERAGADLERPPRGRYREAVVLQRAWKVLGTFEKMLLKGRAGYAAHRDTARRVILEQTGPGGPYAALVRFLAPTAY